MAVPLLVSTVIDSPRRSVISHVIPLRLLQILNLCRWNCNVFRRSQKMTVGNYVRNLSGPGAAAAHRHRSRAPTSPCQFRMQFPSGIALVRIGLRRCVTCVFELHAKFVWTRPCRRPPHRWGLVCCCVGEPRLCLAFGTKFSLLGFLVVRTVQNSPCMSKKRQIEPFRVSWESFVPEVGPCGSCWESFVPHMRCEGCAGRVLYRSGAAWFLLGEICFVVAPSVCAVVGLPPPTGAPSWPSASAARSTLVAVGVLQH